METFQNIYMAGCPQLSALHKWVEPKAAFAHAFGNFSLDLFTRVYPDGQWFVRAHRAGRIDDATYRRKLADLQCEAGARMFRQICSDMKIKIRRGRRLKNPPKQCVVVANHRSVLDIPMMFEVFQQLGLTHVRWVMKDILRYAPVLGPLCVESGCAFVNRSRDPKDIQVMHEKAALARKEGASLFIFPEGTRFTGEPDKGYEQLLRPKATGFGIIYEHFRGLPSVAISHRVETVKHARNLGQMDGIYGATVFLDERLVPAEEIDQNPPDALSRIWVDTDQLLRAA